MQDKTIINKTKIQNQNQNDFKFVQSRRLVQFLLQLKKKKFSKFLKFSKNQDWVYCEVSPFQPYVIRKIEELTKVNHLLKIFTPTLI